jgi:DNA-binding IclR family transcriptional regulator
MGSFNNAVVSDGAVQRTVSVPAVERALRILEFLARSRRGVTVSQLTRELRLPKSSSYALLLTLERGGYAERDPCSGRYRPGLRLCGLAKSALSGLSIRETGAPFLRKLADQTRLTAHMAVLEEAEAVLIEKIVPTTAPFSKISTWAGKRIQLHCTALGKALLAHLAESEIEDLIGQHGLLRHNQNTIASLPTLKEQCAQVRNLGYSVDDEEEEIGIRCVGAPVLDGQQRVLAAISVTGTIIQLKDMDHYANLVKQVAQALSARLTSSDPAT